MERGEEGGKCSLLLCFSWGTVVWGLAWVELRSRQWFGMGVGGGIYQDGDVGVWWMQVFPLCDSSEDNTIKVFLRNW